MPKGMDIGLVGEVTNVDTTLINTLIDNDFVPVISSIGVDEEGKSYNVNADYAAVAVAGALKAEKLVFVTDVAGIMRDVNDPNSVISVIKEDEVNALIEDGTISGGMLPKVQCCMAGVEAGVKNVHILDGRTAHCPDFKVYSLFPRFPINGNIYLSFYTCSFTQAFKIFKSSLQRYK